jgi:hypothetical protein
MLGRNMEGTVERMREKENHARQKEGGHSGKDDQKENHPWQKEGGHSGKDEKEGESC